MLAAAAVLAAFFGVADAVLCDNCLLYNDNPQPLQGVGTQVTCYYYSCSNNGHNCNSGSCMGLYCTYSLQRQSNGSSRKTQGCSDVPQILFDDGTVMTQLNTCQTKNSMTGSTYNAMICNTNYCNADCTPGGSDGNPQRDHKECNSFKELSNVLSVIFISIFCLLNLKIEGINYAIDVCNSGSFCDKNVPQCGSSIGIGRQTEKGAKIVITGRNSAELEETKRQCTGVGASEEDVLENFGKIDVLVNIVDDTDSIGKPMIGMTEWDAMLNLTAQALVRLTLDAVPHLERTRGAIVNVSPIGSMHTMKAGPSGAKPPLDQITIQLADSLFWKGIRVNSVNYESVHPRVEVKQEVIDRLSSPPLQLPSIPEKTGKTILFIADRSRSAILVGQIIAPNGQLTSRSAIAPHF